MHERNEPSVSRSRSPTPTTKPTLGRKPAELNIEFASSICATVSFLNATSAIEDFP